MNEGAFLKAKIVKAAFANSQRNVYQGVENSLSLTLTSQNTYPPSLGTSCALVHKEQYLFIAIGLQDLTDFSLAVVTLKNKTRLL